MLRFVSILALVLLFAVGASAQSIDYGRSHITILSKQMNVPVEAPFKRFKADIAWNDAKPEASKARVEVELASFDIGDADVNENVRDSKWFDVNNHPTAIFVSTSIRALGNGHFEVRGPLTMKGKTQEVMAPFSVKPSGVDRIFDGQFPIRRLQYNIGDGPWRDTSVVADEVLIKFRLYEVAGKRPPKK